MLQYFLTNIILIALGIMLYVVVRSLPRLGEQRQGKSMNIIERWMHSGIPQRIDAALEVSSLKFLRKTKVVLLRADNALSKHLQQKVRKGSNGANQAIDFSDIHTNARGSGKDPAAVALGTTEASVEAE